MSDDVPQIQLGLSDAGDPVVLIGRLGDQADSMPALLRGVPGLATPPHATDLALAVNHLAHGSEYQVITDPPGFETAYRTRLDSEDPAAEWREGVIRLRDFGVPEFGTIAPPRLAGSRLTFFAVDTFIGVPYRVELSDMAAPPEYKPLPLDPLPAPPPRHPKPDRVPPTQEELDERETHMPGDLAT